MKISLIVAASDNNVIGLDNKLPWHQPADLKFFKNTTWGMAVAMGRKTFDAIGKILPGRTNIVITGNPAWQCEGAVATHSIADALSCAASLGYREIFITGGGEIFRRAMEMADLIYLTRVHAEIAGDTFFPEIDTYLFSRITAHEVSSDEKNKYDMTFETWQKKRDENNTAEDHH